MNQAQKEHSESAMKSPSKMATILLPSVVDIIFIRMFINIIRRPISSLDIWWHLKTGEWIVNKGAVPHLNLYSFTAPDAVWITHEWLSQLVFYLMYSMFGGSGLAFLRALLFATMLIVIYKTLTNGGTHFLLAVLLIILGSQLLVPAATLRPWLFSNLLAALLIMLFSGTKSEKRWYFAMPVILWLWSNFHGSYVIGYIICFLKLIELYTSPADRKGVFKRFLGLYLLSCALLFVNPNGLSLLFYPLKYRLGSLFFAYITEWQQPDFHSLFGLIFEVYLGLLILSVLYSGKKLTISELLTVIIFIHLSLTAKRNAPYLLITTVPILSNHLTVFLRAWRLKWEQRIREKGTFWSQLLTWCIIETDRLAFLDRNFRKHTYLICFMVGVLLYFSVSPQEAPGVAYDFQKELAPGFPVAAVDYLKERNISGPLLNYFNWGGYLIWHLYPQVKVFIDGRADPYPPEILKDYYSLHHLNNWRSILDRYQIEWVLYPTKEHLTQVLDEAEDWIKVYHDENAVLFQRIKKDVALKER
ncbi:hypothetical protein ACFL27_17205 [candidate division CSSED10-310 bacterium]|uniref:Glycosyltransferase RgtA/B/C/D-like domain-containing protein n=1 Tax=candidate division CSSED10-310 bacterium TaxID=2855610 RepID=A0ABV6Z0G5_UNCC1